ncbi:MAG: hypothetical protein U0264_11135 [Candidatus Kapaibacterium sp.]
MENITINMGEFEVLQSGTIINIRNTPITFTINNLTFNINLEDSLTVEKITFTATDKTTLDIRFPIPKSAALGLGGGTNEPLELGLIGSKSLYLNMRVNVLNETAGITVHYTWMLKKK